VAIACPTSEWAVIGPRLNSLKIEPELAAAMKPSCAMRYGDRAAQVRSFREKQLVIGREDRAQNHSLHSIALLLRHPSRAV